MERRRKKGGGGIKFQQKISLRLFASCLALPKYCQHTHIHAMVLMTQLKLTMLHGTGKCRCNAEHKDSTNEAAQDETK